MMKKKGIRRYLLLLVLVLIMAACTVTASAEETQADDEEETLIDLSDAQLTLEYTKTEYTGEAQKPAVTVELSGETLPSSDYKVSYADNKSIGKAIVTVKGKGDYTGSVSATFKILPGTSEIKSVTWSTSAAKTLSVKVSKVSGSVSGYQLQYRSVGNKNWKTLDLTGTTGTIGSLTNSKQYYVRVRAYKIVSEKTYYGSWSSRTKVESRYQRTIKVNGSKKTLHHTAGKWSTKNGYKYYTISSTGKKAKKTFLNIKGEIYYFDSKGRMYTSWHKIGDDYYFFNRSSGKMASGETVEKVKITKYGTASTSKSIYVKRMKVYIAAREFMEDCTSASDSKSAKLKKCFKALFPYPYHQYRKLKNIYKTANWELDFANDIFVREQGCCVSLAAAFAYLARECGYTDVYIGHDTSHAWTMVNGYVYDPLFAEAKGWSGNYHGSSKSDYRTYVPYKREI